MITLLPPADCWKNEGSYYHLGPEHDSGGNCIGIRELASLKDPFLDAIQGITHELIHHAIANLGLDETAQGILDRLPAESILKLIETNEGWEEASSDFWSWKI